MTLSAQRIAEALGKARRSGDGWTCLCPAHDDHDPSLSISDLDDGKILVHCHANCTQQEVIEALTERGLWPITETQARSLAHSSRGNMARDWRPIVPAPADAPKPNTSLPGLGSPDLVHEYRGENNELLGYVLRYENEGGEKTFRPLTYCESNGGQREWRQKGLPKPLPLYGLNRLSERSAAPVLVVEGEKAANAARELLFDMVPVSWPGGAKNATHADWSVLKGRDVIIWPDADEEGIVAAEAISKACLDTGAQSVKIIKPPDDAPKGWDVADALAEDIDAAALSKLIASAQPHRIIPNFTNDNAPVLTEWTAERYCTPPPSRDWLVNGVLPLGAPCMLAAFGGVGKSLTALDMALKVATYEQWIANGAPAPSSLGSTIEAGGTAVILTAEDDVYEVHRRMDALDPDGLRNENPDRLIVVPLPNAGGALTLLTGGFERPEITPQFIALYEQLADISDLRLIVFDPMQAFVGADANKDPAAAQYLCTLLGQLAANTGATVLVTHHFRKQGNIDGPSAAREAIRGTTALIDGMRCVFAYWAVSEDYAGRICKELGISFQPQLVFNGAVVKANWPVEMKVRKYIRGDTGLLCDQTHRIWGNTENRDYLLDQLVGSIAEGARDGMPYTKSGKAGVYENREELTADLKKFGRNRLQALTQELLDSARILKCAKGKSGTRQWLDVPDGPFAKGIGEFKPGARRRH